MPDPSTRADDAQKPVDLNALTKRLTEASRNIGGAVILTDFNDPENARHNMGVLEEAAQTAKEVAYEALARLRALSGAVPTISEEGAEALYGSRGWRESLPVAGVPPEQDEDEAWKRFLVAEVDAGNEVTMVARRAWDAARDLAAASVPVEAQTDDDVAYAAFLHERGWDRHDVEPRWLFVREAFIAALRSRSSSPVGLSEEQIAAINALRHRIRGDNGISDAFSYQHNDALDAVLRALERTNPATRCTCSDPAIIGCPVHDEALRNG